MPQRHCTTAYTGAAATTQPFPTGGNSSTSTRTVWFVLDRWQRLFLQDTFGRHFWLYEYVNKHRHSWNVLRRHLLQRDCILDFPSLRNIYKKYVYIYIYYIRTYMWASETEPLSLRTLPPKLTCGKKFDLILEKQNILDTYCIFIGCIHSLTSRLGASDTGTFVRSSLQAEALYIPT